MNAVLNILLLEDNNDLALMLRQMLEWKGHHVVHGINGQQGIELITRTPFLPDLILCDLIMPEMDGLTFLQWLRANRNWARIPFIIMSANVYDAGHEYAVKHGADGCLMKPFSMEELNHVLMQWG